MPKHHTYLRFSKLPLYVKKWISYVIYNGDNVRATLETKLCVLTERQFSEYYSDAIIWINKSREGRLFQKKLNRCECLHEQPRLLMGELIHPLHIPVNISNAL